MAQTQAEASPLDQLQAQVNLVLEHTGRIVANSARNGKGASTTVTPPRLKQVFSGALDNFHDALDALEEELTLARAVMRRDLAVYRATQAEHVTKDDSNQGKTGLNPGQGNGNASPQVKPEMDTEMTVPSSPAPKVSPQQSPAAPSQDVPPVPVTSGQAPTSEDATAKPETKEEPRDALKVEIPSGDHQSSDNPADAQTGTYSNFDFESLFNDSGSAGGASRASPAAAQTEDAAPSQNLPAPPEPAASGEQQQQQEKPPEPEAADADQNNEFDFGDLTNFGNNGGEMNNNDNISSLLPGLESYAQGADDSNGDQQQNANDTFNIFDTAPGGSDFSASQVPKDDANAGQTNTGETGNQAENAASAQNGESAPADLKTDDVFGDIMNFDNFDLDQFGADSEEGEPKFDASFFDI